MKRMSALVLLVSLSAGAVSFQYAMAGEAWKGTFSGPPTSFGSGTAGKYNFCLRRHPAGQESVQVVFAVPPESGCEPINTVSASTPFIYEESAKNPESLSKEEVRAVMDRATQHPKFKALK